ncbi:MAG: serine hydrolase [Bacteroidales bacterium]|jgi:CubicO group peptidase (beta-lactamase class C family)|nr:serine hydrolase [Bacteroidales bacterium]
MKKIFNIIILAIILSSCSEEQAVNERIQKTVEEYAARGHFNGSIVIAHKDSIIYKGSFGYADIETIDTISSSTLFPIASLTKQFTSTAIMILQERGKLNINDRIGNYLEVNKIMQDIPIKNFMNHTSGIFNYLENNIESNKDSILKFHNNCDTLYFSVNSKYHYCNSNYFFLGLLIEQVSVMTYNDFLTENIFKPTGMNSTFVYDGKEYDRAIGYDKAGNINDYLITTADGGIISTIDDLLLWDIALSENTILTEESKNKMFEPCELNNGEINSYGFGWELKLNSPVSVFDLIMGNSKNENIVSHSGGLASFAAYNQFDTENDLFIILLSNQKRHELFDLKEDVNKELYL